MTQNTNDTARTIATLIADAASVTVLTGAGMSAESGVPTFRGRHDSLWSRFDPQHLATAEAWRTDKALVWGWYRWRMALVQQAQPHAGHIALAALAAKHGGISLLTQNVDDLHERAGSQVTAHVHGSLFALRCFDCARPYAASLAVADPQTTPLRLAPPQCTHCGGDIRPGVVWFGESLPEDAWTHAETAAGACDLMLVIGTSGLVFPVAGLPALAQRHGATVVEINPEATALTPQADLHWHATAAGSLPQLLQNMVN